MVMVVEACLDWSRGGELNRASLRPPDYCSTFLLGFFFSFFLSTVLPLHFVPLVALLLWLPQARWKITQKGTVNEIVDNTGIAFITKGEQ